MRGAGLVLLAACGGSSSEPTASVVVPSLVAPRETADDGIVATVNGRPIWGSCVAHQAKPRRPVQGDAATPPGSEVRDALNECIAFELLAQAAEQREVASTPEVAEARRTAMVDRLIAMEFEAKVKTMVDLGPRYAALVDKNAFRMHRPDLRASAYVRIDVPPKASPEVDAKAHATAERIAAALRNETGLFPIDMNAIADRVAAGAKLSEQVVKLLPADGLEKPYSDALFAIPAIGSTAGPIRTSYGWDVILWTGALPKYDVTREVLEQELFPEMRRHYFSEWVDQLGRAAGIVTTVDEAQLANDDKAGS